MAPSEMKQNPVIAIAQRFMLALSSFGTIFVLIMALKYSAYGFDFTDESFYLVWMANPFIYDFSHTQFGFVYHPLYLFLNGEIAALRQANIFISFGLGWCLAYLFFTSFAPEANEERGTLHIVSAGVATSALTLFNLGLPTPSYNSLALQALLVSAIGLLKADKFVTFKSAVGWVLIGIGGWLAFMAKPSTALALAIAVLIYLLVSRRFSIWLFLLAAASALVPLLVSALVIDGSIWGFIERLQFGFEFARLLGGGHTLDRILRIDDFQLNTFDKQAMCFVLIGSFVASRGIFSENKRWLFVSLPLSIAFLALTAILAFGLIRGETGLGFFQGLLIFGVVLSAVLSGLMFCRLKNIKCISLAQWSIMFLFFVMPHIYAFGTNGNYWQRGSGAGIFWLLAGLTPLAALFRERASWLFALPFVLATQTVTAALLQAGLEQPYRQPEPLRLNEAFLKIGPQRSSLVLSSGFASYISDAVEAAQDANFNAGTPVIDLTGQSPGILYALGAESIGQVWVVGGYPGSLSFAKAGLGRTPCNKIAEAWVLFEPDGPRSIPTEVMSALGVVFPEGYIRVGAWQTAEGAGGYAVSRRQLLYKPIAQKEALKTCQLLRGEIK